MTALTTSRLLLRRWRPEDLPIFARWQADADFTRYMRLQTYEQSVETFARYERHWDRYGFGSLAIELLATAELIGQTGVSFHRLWSADPEVGWKFGPLHWGYGYATEAGAACVGWAFGELDFHRLASITRADNIASRRVMAKLGFRLDRELADGVGTALLHLLDRSVA